METKSVEEKAGGTVEDRAVGRVKMAAASRTVNSCPKQR